MIKVSFFYPNTEGSTFDFDYYCNTHIALSQRRLAPALKSFSVDYGISGIMAESKPPFHVVGHLLFDSIEAFYEALTPHIEELKGDVVNYTDVEAIIQISEVKISEVIG
jgi:uncharacterized protein (TIGR02118 family)